MKTWIDTIDPSTIPDAVLYAEIGRRRSQMRQTRSGGRNGGRPPKLYPCPTCGAEIEGRVAFAAHVCKPQQQEKKRHERTRLVRS